MRSLQRHREDFAEYISNRNAMSFASALIGHKLSMPHNSIRPKYLELLRRASELRHNSAYQELALRSALIEANEQFGEYSPQAGCVWVELYDFYECKASDAGMERASAFIRAIIDRITR